MRCENIKELLAAYLDGELTPQERGQIEAHLPACEKCREELRRLTSIREDLRQAMSAKAAGVEPSPQVWERVRQRTDSESSFWEQFSTLLTRPIWRAAIPIVLVLVVIGALWGTGVLPGFRSGTAPAPTPGPTVGAPTVIPRPTSAPTTTVPAPVITIPPAPMTIPAPHPAPPPVFGVTAVTAKTSYLPGEPIEIEFSIANKAAEPITLVSLPPSVVVIKPAPYTVFRVLPAGTRVRSLNPGEADRFTLTWDQKDDAGQQVPPGWYYFEVTVATTPPAVSGSTTTPIKVLIQYPQGAMEKTIDVNQSQTVNGITITLERVELSATGLKIYAFNTPPGYQIPVDSSGNVDPQTDLWSVRAMAGYSIDGGSDMFAGPSNIRFSSNGMTHTWDNLDPVGKTARELIFIVTRLGEPLHKDYWQGPWEFKIPLQ